MEPQGIGQRAGGQTLCERSGHAKDGPLPLEEHRSLRILKLSLSLAMEERAKWQPNKEILFLESHFQPKRIENMCPHKNWTVNACSSIVHSSRKVEMTKMSLSWRSEEQSAVYPCELIWLGHKNEGCADTHHCTDEQADMPKERSQAQRPRRAWFCRWETFRLGTSVPFSRDGSIVVARSWDQSEEWPLMGIGFHFRVMRLFQN